MRNTYSTLSSVASSVQNANTVVTGPILQSLRSLTQPVVDPTLNRYIANAFADLDSRTNMALNTIRSMTNGTSWVNASTGSQLTSAISTMGSYAGNEAASMTRVGISNVNNLVNIANNLNANSIVDGQLTQNNDVISNRQISGNLKNPFSVNLYLLSYDENKNLTKKHIRK